jgi:hypothetical protein
VRAKAIVAFLAATAIVGASALPTAASAAKIHRVREPASVDAQLHGRGTDGFNFVFFTLGSRGNLIWFTKRVSPGGEESAVYFIRPHGGRADFDGGTLNVRIGRLGRFRGRFVPTSARAGKPRNGCTGEPATTEKGYFVGSFSFHGERGYTAVHAHRERATVTRQGVESCPAPSAPKHVRRQVLRRATEGQQRRQNELRLVAGDSEADLLLRAEREESAEKEEGSPTNFQASVSEAVGRIGVSRSASVIAFGAGAATTFQTPNPAEPLAEATLAPPAPFSGSATFHLDDPHTATWSGDLTVELPGLGKVPLTGEGIQAGVCKGPSHCTKTLPEPLQRQLEAGPGVTYFTGKATTKAPSAEPTS